MESAKIEVLSDYSQIQFWGIKSDEEPVWDSTSRFGRAKHAFLIGVAKDGESYELEVHFAQRPSYHSEKYGSGEIEVDDLGIEIADVQNSTIDGVEGILGIRYQLNWIGTTRLDIYPVGEMETSDDGLQFPTSFEIYIYPNPQN